MPLRHCGLWMEIQVDSFAVSKQRARQLLQATVFYLPLLFIVMMLDTVSS